MTRLCESDGRMRVSITQAPAAVKCEVALALRV
jgi:hypothetical protein